MESCWHKIMYVLYQQEKPIYVKEVARKARMSDSNTLTVLQAIEEKGWVASKKERCKRYYWLTETGKQVGSAINHLFNSIK